MALVGLEQSLDPIDVTRLESNELELTSTLEKISLLDVIEKMSYSTHRIEGEVRYDERC